MKISIVDKSLAYLALITGLAISAVAIYYSVAGLVSIFAAAVIPIIIMGVVLELGKLVATLWLKQNWSIAPRFIKGYLLSAVVLLMFITSMGTFGYLSKAHLDQSVPTSDIADRVALIDEKISTQKDNIEFARKALAQMDAAVDQTIARSTSEQGATRAAQLRKNQSKERTSLQNDIAKAQLEISKLNDERAPIAKELRKVEAEVGPIKYIAALIYGDELDQTLLENAVRWVIILIVIIFDPLAVVLLLASQYSFQYIRNSSEDKAELPVVEELPAVVEEPAKTEDTVQEDTPKLEPEFDISKHPYLFKTGGGFKNLKPMVYRPEPEPVVSEELLPVVEEVVQLAPEELPPVVEEIVQNTPVVEELESPSVTDKSIEPTITEVEEPTGYIVKDHDKQIKMVFVPTEKKS